MLRPIRRLASAVYETLDTPVSLSCYIMLKHGEWDQLAVKQANPLHYRDSFFGAARYAKDAQACDFLRKYEKLPTSINKQQAAEDTFRSAEMQCFETNTRLLNLELGQSPESETLRSFLRRAKNWISRVLGPLPDRAPLGGFGPGTAFELKGSGLKPCTITKCWTAPALTPMARDLFTRASEGHPLWERRRRLGLPDFSTCRGNRFTTVPKDGKTDRGICIEPGGNLLLQLGVGGYLKERLSRIGIQLHSPEEVSRNPADFRVVRKPVDAQQLHRRLARRASIDGATATIDLSSASDTVSYQLVRQLLPGDWFEYLARIRSPLTLFNGRWVHLSKFSSMGNGFTFELETLIFASLAYASGGSVGVDTFVYGDDILVPTGVSRALLPLLEFCGFTVNEKKTFTTGPFRESCGGDYFLGYVVRPYQLKTHPLHANEVAAIQRELVERKLPWQPLTDLCTEVLYGPPNYECFTGPEKLWKTRELPGFRAIRVYRPVPQRWGKGRFSDELHILAHLAGEPDPFNPTIRGQAACRTRLVWLPPAE